MEQTKAAIKDFTSKSGHHDTTVHENVAPSVQHETVKPTRHENITTAVDKEIHQDHYHRTVQPVHDREVLPEKHTAKLGGVQHREFDHRDHDSSKRALASEQRQFKDERVVHDTKHTQSAAPTVGGEHVHHHIHETIQPVVHKETIQPHVVHTTVPIHETHHHASKHHAASTLPAVSMDEFKAKGGVLGGREERYDAFDGEPKHFGGSLTGHHDSNKRDSHHTRDGVPSGTLGKTEGDIHHHTGTVGKTERDLKHPTTSTTHGTHSATGTNTAHTTTPHGKHSATAPTTGTTGTTHGTDPRGLSGLGHRENGTTGANDPLNKHTPTSNNLNKSNSVGSTKPSLLDRINPLKDADGDGKKGFMK